MSLPVIAERYACERSLGEGGFGKTYLARDRLQGEIPCVVKILGGKVDSAAEKEFSLLKSLYHPHIVEVFTYGRIEGEGGGTYLVMEFVDGVPIDRALPALRKEDDWGPIAELCRTLSYIHSQKVIHGDLKPSNILVVKKGRGSETTHGIKVIDFGLAEVVESQAARELPSGTIAYMAPEVIRQGARTARSDLYSLGILLYQLLSGNLPFPLTPEAALRFHLHGEPAYDFLARHPWGKSLEKILRRLLDKDPSRRPQDALEILTALNEEEETRFEIHRGREKTGDEGLFFQKVDDYLNGVNQVLRLSSVNCPRSFLAEELGRIEKYLGVAAELSPAEAALWVGRLTETKARIFLQQGRYEEVLAIEGGSDGFRNIRALAEIYRERYDEAEKILAGIARDSPDESEKVRAENYLGIAAYNRGDMETAEARFRGAYEETRRLKDTTGIVSNAMNLAAIYQQQGRIAEAMGLYKDSLAAAEELKNSYLLSILLSNVANLHIHVGGLEEAETHLERSQALAKELNLRLLTGYGLLLSADIAMWRRDHARADRALEEAASVFQKLKSAMYLALAWVNYAENGLRAHLWGDMPGRIAKAQAAVSRTNLPEAKFRLSLLSLQFRIHEKKDLGGVPKKIEALEKEASSRIQRIQVLSVRARWALAGKEPDLCEEHLSRAKKLLQEEQEALPIAYRRNVEQAPRFALLQEVMEESVRLRKAPADGSLWKLVEINQRIVGQRDPHGLYGLILDSAMELTGAERGFLIMPEYGKWKRGTWKVQTARHFRLRDLPGGRDLLSRTIINRLLEGRKPLLIHNAQEEKDLKEFKSIAALRLRSILAVPIVVYGEMIGALYLDHSDASSLFEEKDLKLLKAFADQAGIAVTQCRQYEETVRQKKALEEAREQLEETNRRLEEELEKKTHWAERIEEELKKVQEAGPIIARSPVMKHIVRQLRPIATTRRPVVLTGEIGTGKGLIAQTLHGLGGSGPFVRRQAREFIDGGEGRRPREVLEGFVEEGRGGTLEVDELSELTPPYQREILHLLGTLEEAGEEGVQVVLTSRLSLQSLRDKGLVILELAQYLSGAEIRIPPLRERKEDIGPLVRHFLKELDEKRGFPREITRSAMGILYEHDWPGNVQELRLEIEKAALASHLTIEPFDLSPNLLGKTEFVPGAPKKGAVDLRETRGRFERDSILQALERSRGNKVRAAKRLGLSRAMLYIKIKQYQIPLK